MKNYTDQIGNTITYFTRAHVAGNVSEMDLDIDGASDAALPEMEAELGLKKLKTKKLRKTLTNQCSQCGIKSNNNL